MQTQEQDWQVLKTKGLNIYTSLDIIKILKYITLLC